MKTGWLDIFKRTLKAHSSAGHNPETDRSDRIGNVRPINTMLIDDVVTEWLGSKTGSNLKLDRVLSASLKENVISPEDVGFWMEASEKQGPAGRTSPLTWKEVIKLDPWRAQQLERMASWVYGFRSVLICQMSSLVLADMLTVRILPKHWNEMFEIGLVPVVEHGESPIVNGRVVCVSKDPTSRRVRDYVNGITAFQTELAYADGPVVVGMLEMISQHVPAIGATVYVTRPALQKVSVIEIPNKRAA